MRDIHKNIKNNILALTFFDAHVSILLNQKTPQCMMKYVMYKG